MSLLFVDEEKVEIIINKIILKKSGFSNEYIFKNLLDIYNDITEKEKNALYISTELYEDRKGKIQNVLTKK